MTKLEDERRAKSQLERYHSPAIVNRILEAREPAEMTQLEVREQEVSILFSDLVGFTSLTENMPPRDVAHMLNDYFSLMTEVIFKHEGTLDKFIGDAIMAVFGSPFPSSDHALKAVECAREMRVALSEFNQERAGRDAPLEFRIGINTGRVVAGDIGSPQRMEYTVLGNTVNMASRLESEVARPGSIVIGDSTFEKVRETIACRRLEGVTVKGISRLFNAYEVIG
jgi:adenylate cyclase